MPAAQRRGSCGSCTHFSNEPATLEKALPGYTAMGSGHASVSCDDGLCQLHGLYLSAADSCPSFASRLSPDQATVPG